MMNIVNAGWIAWWKSGTCKVMLKDGWVYL